MRTGKYYLVLLFNVDIQPKKPVEGKIGIDAGVKDFITLSTGEKINYPNRMKVWRNASSVSNANYPIEGKGQTITLSRSRT